MLWNATILTEKRSLCTPRAGSRSPPNGRYAWLDKRPQAREPDNTTHPTVIRERRVARFFGASERAKNNERLDASVMLKA